MIIWKLLYESIIMINLNGRNIYVFVIFLILLNFSCSKNKGATLELVANYAENIIDRLE